MDEESDDFAFYKFINLLILYFIRTIAYIIDKEPHILSGIVFFRKLLRSLSQFVQGFIPFKIRASEQYFMS